MDLLAIAQQGLQQAQGHFDSAVKGIMQASLPSQPADTVSLSDAAVSLMSSKNQYGAAVDVAHIADEMDMTTLNLLA